MNRKGEGWTATHSVTEFSSADGSNGTMALFKVICQTPEENDIVPIKTKSYWLV